MKRFFKWLLIVLSLFLVFIIAAIIIVPKVIDLKKYKPLIEEEVVKATGRSFTLGDEIDISVFPWVGIKLIDVNFGNPAGYSEKEMISVKKFEVRLKVIPLLKKEIEVKTFILDSPVIYLEKLKTGKANWEEIGAGPGKKEANKEKSDKGAPEGDIPIKGLIVKNFSINNGELIYIDQAAGIKKDISDLNLKLTDINLENPVKILFTAVVDGSPLSLKGKAGPIGKNPGKGKIPFNFTLKAMNELEAELNGSLSDPMTSLSFDLGLTVSSFSPRKLFKAFNQQFPVKTKDSSVFNEISLKTHVKGNKENISFSDGEIILDDSKVLFSAAAKNFSKPDLEFDFKLDSMDLDRYLPEPPEKNIKPESEAKQTKKIKSAEKDKKKTDYTPLRKLVLNGKIRAGYLKVHGAKIKNINVQIMAKNGKITIDPCSLDLYQGSIASKVKLNVQKNNPVTKLAFSANGIKAGLLLKDAMETEVIEGTVKSKIALTMTGDTPEMIKKTLNGKGELFFIDGAIIGIDLAGMVRNIKTKFLMGEKKEEKPKTDFAELKVLFTAKNGLLFTPGSSLISPFLRVIAKGDVNLVTEALNLRVDPKFVATLKGQGDTVERSGLMVPVLITGTFASPEYSPDLEGIINNNNLDIKEINKQVKELKEEKEEIIESVKKDPAKQIESLLQGFEQ